MTAATVTVTAVTRHGGELAAHTSPVRMDYDNFGNAGEFNRFVAAPEYGPGWVLAVGFKLKKDGTPGRQVAKPALPLSWAPAEVRSALAENGYPRS